MELQEFGVYIVKDDFFSDFPRPCFLDNKGESRPHFFAVRDPTGTAWLIPMSSKVDKYRALIEKAEAKRGKGNCIYYHIGVIAGKERAFNIGDMFPVTESYIRHAFTISGIPYVVRDKTLSRALRSKAVRLIRLWELGKLMDRNGVLEIRESLRK